jgi:hypothetical protein
MSEGKVISRKGCSGLASSSRTMSSSENGVLRRANMEEK